MTYVNPMLNESTLLSTYEKGRAMDIYWELEKLRFHLAVDGFRRIFEQIESYVHVGNLCDIGTGLGAALVAAKQRGWNVNGVEPSVKSQQWLKDNFDINIGAATIDDADFALSQFDLVTMFQVIEHLAEPRRVLKQILPLLKPGAILYVGCPNIDSFSCKLLGKAHVHYGGKNHLNYFTPHTLRRVLIECGYEIVRQSTHRLDVTACDLIRKIHNVERVHREGDRFLSPLEAKLARSIDLLIKPFFDRLISRNWIQGGSYQVAMAKRRG
jgi:2-polyprenyl-3-methyl-5-hydroxy-6-metoxy-1,4-benzoquinol methylase